jgi:hypothetical protein
VGKYVSGFKELNHDKFKLMTYYLGDYNLGKIKGFLKRDSDILRNTVLFLFGLIIGINKLFYDHRILYKVLGFFYLSTSIVLLIVIIKEFKRLNKNDGK